MPIDYFANCKTNSKNKAFGICDDPHPSSNPAYIDEHDSSKWIGIVKNDAEKNINFNAIDHCVEIMRPDGKMAKRCDGVLSHDNRLIFVELKEREGGQWFQKGREQITDTINRFKSEQDITVFTDVKGYVCNSLRPMAHVGQLENIQKFKDDTGFLLIGKRVIEIGG